VSGPVVVALVGATASGKSRAAHAAALADGNCEIVALDSMTAYREMDLATAKPTPADRAEVRYHLVDVLDPSEELSVRRFQALADTALDEIAARGATALLVGGSGLYHRAVVDALTIPPTDPDVRAELEREADVVGLDALFGELEREDPVAATRIERRNRRRVIRALEVIRTTRRPFSSFGAGLDSYPDGAITQLGITYDAARGDAAIDARFRAWLDDGLLDEVRALSARPSGLSRTARQAAGYRQLLTHVEEGVAIDDAVAAAIGATKRLARRQWRWFRRDPRIEWVPNAAAATERLATMVRASD
jgi:tRNA dimethylallyltransferase